MIFNIFKRVAELEREVRELRACQNITDATLSQHADAANTNAMLLGNERAELSLDRVFIVPYTAGSKIDYGRKPPEGLSMVSASKYGAHIQAIYNEYINRTDEP